MTPEKKAQWRQIFKLIKDNNVTMQWLQANVPQADERLMLPRSFGYGPGCLISEDKGGDFSDHLEWCSNLLVFETGFMPQELYPKVYATGARQFSLKMGSLGQRPGCAELAFAIAPKELEAIFVEYFKYQFEDPLNYPGVKGTTLWGYKRPEGVNQMLQAGSFADMKTIAAKRLKTKSYFRKEGASDLYRAFANANNIREAMDEYQRLINQPNAPKKSRGKLLPIKITIG